MELAKQHFAIGKQSMREKYRFFTWPVQIFSSHRPPQFHQGSGISGKGEIHRLDIFIFLGKKPQG